MTMEAGHIGRITSVSGASITAALDTGPDGAAAVQLRIGDLVKMATSESVVYGVVDRLMREAGGAATGTASQDVVVIDLMGEVMTAGDAAGQFQVGVSVHPTLGAGVAKADTSDIALVYARPSESTVPIGTVYQDRNIPAHLMIDALLGKHFAVLGTTGSGKSCTLALILRSILSAHANGHVVLLDAHAEYGKAFGDMAEVIDVASLQLPHWLLDFEEAVAVLVKGGDRAQREAQIAILRDAILHAKRMHAGDQADAGLITVDTPVPYRLGDLIKTIDDAMGKLDKPDNSIPYLRLKRRLESLNNDKRFGFMFPGRIVRDELAPILSRLLRMPVEGKPMTIIDISGVPSEVVDVVVSVFCRVIFDFALWADRSRAQPILLVCEEAHRYIPHDETAGFESTKRSITRIAKEGRKYGVSLCLVTQRPSELSASILSQCGTLFALRMNNEADQHFVARSLPETAAGLIAALPELRVQEALVMGVGVSLPMRVHLADLHPAHQPRSESADFSVGWQFDKEGVDFVADTIQRWREQRRQNHYSAAAQMAAEPAAAEPTADTPAIDQAAAAEPASPSAPQPAEPSQANPIDALRAMTRSSSPG